MGEFFTLVSSLFGESMIPGPLIFGFQSFLLIILLSLRSGKHSLLFLFHLKRIIRSAFSTMILFIFLEFIFYMIDSLMLFRNIGRITESLNYSDIFIAQKWFIYCVIFSISFSYIDSKKLFQLPFIITGVLAGIIGLLIFVLAKEFIPMGTFRRGAVFIPTLLIFIFLLDFNVYKYSLAKLVLLNGPLVGNVFYLGDSVTTIGTQESDDINLSLYPDINISHAKIIPYGGLISLVDNDPYRRTLINFQNVTEKILKSEDIIGIGSARILVLI